MSHDLSDDDDLFDSNDVKLTNNPVHAQGTTTPTTSRPFSSQQLLDHRMSQSYYNTLNVPYQPFLPPLQGQYYSQQPQSATSAYSSGLVSSAEYNEKARPGSVIGMQSPPVRPKGVAFKEQELEYPQSTYMLGRNGNGSEFFGGSQYEMERIDPYDLDGPLGGASFGGHLRPYSQHLTFTGDDYLINPLEDANDDDELDPFGDDDSLFSDTGEEIVRRGTTIRKRGGATSSGSQKKSLSLKGKKKSKKKKRMSIFGDGDVAEEHEVLDEDDDDEILFPDEDDFRPRLNYTKTIKKVMLVNGNYVIDAPVPKALLENYGKTITDGGREMSFMRYTAATCGPLNFLRFNYCLRQPLYSPPRQTEIMICVTMYNENEILLARTLKGIFANIRNLLKRSDPMWGEDSWKKVVVTIVVDGRANLHERAEALLVALGVYQDGYAKSRINDKDVKAHIYEYTSTVGIEAVNDRVHLEANSTPVQFLFCLKEKNARKINSHRWCMQSFAPILKPNIIMLLDCGTQPAKDAFYYLWRAFRDENVAGACGEMRAALGPSKKLLSNPLVAAQNFEYKISNILDKPMESVFGFITVLPGAFSAYRYDALLNVNGEGPLEKYFKGEFLHQGADIDEDDDERKLKERNYQQAGIFTSNMYLAEDRILCFELVAKKNHNYVLRYVKEATAETDVPEKMDEFVLQRRRWLNGSFFAAGYALFHWSKIWKSNHSLGRKLFLQLEFYYQLITLLVSWFSLSCFFLVFRILTQNLGSEDMNFLVGAYLAVIFLWFYAGSVVVTFVLAFGNTPRGTKKFYVVIAIFFAILMAYLMFSAIYLAVHTVQSILNDNPHFNASMIFTNSKFRDLIISVLSTYTLYFIAAFMYGEPSFMLTSFAQYVLLSPTYINVLNIYAFANIHDISWGTKDVAVTKDLGAAKSMGKDKNELVMVAPGDKEEVNESYCETLDNLRALPPVEIPALTKKQKDDSYYAFVRTMTILIWMLTNAILIIIVLDTAGLDTFTGVDNSQETMNKHAQTFLSIILWIVAGLAAFRFIGCTLYLIFKVFRPLKWRLMARKNIKKGTPRLS